MFSGGRYDRLTQRYGFVAAATGFTCNVLNLLQAIEHEQGEAVESTRDVLLFNQREDRTEALSLARMLRNQDLTVARDIIQRDLESSLDYASKNRIKMLLIVAPEGENFVLIRTSDRFQRTITREQLAQEGFLRRQDLFQE